MLIKKNFDKDWKFILDRDCGAYTAYGYRKCGAATGPAAIDYHEGLMRSVDLPHDWGIELLPDRRANTGNGARAISRYMPIHCAPDGDSHLESVSVGWYRKHFSMLDISDGQRVFLEFEGVFRDYAIFVNGIYIDRHNSGYTAATFDITDQVFLSGDNVVSVRVDASQPEGWWYEGAGIYRHVHLLIKDEVYIPYASTQIKTQNTGRVEIKTALVNSTSENKNLTLRCKLSDRDGKPVANETVKLQILPYETVEARIECHVENPQLWDVDSPYLYLVQLLLEEKEEQLAESTRFGFREFSFDANQGMFLNGKHVKVRGACIHQDFGGFGVALPESVTRYKIGLLKSMGVNAYRSAHHPASEDVLRICDEVGMLVMDETRLFGSSEEALHQLSDMVCQHRNHPCIFLWSLGNEEYEGFLQSTDYGKKMVMTAYRRMKKLDDTRLITFGANNGCVHSGVNSIVDIRGFNYIRNLERLTHDEQGKHVPGYYADRYHAEHPNVVMLGTEEASHFLCRGAGVDNFQKGQVVATGENTSMGGSTPEGWVKFYEKRDYLVGGFMWTGVDYYGEPSPFTDRNLSSSFGAVDLVGYPKNSYYYYRSSWIEEPMIKIMPHWDFKEGDTVKVAVYSNCDQVALSLNGKFLGEKKLESFDSAIWTIPFEAGRLEAKGEKNGVVYQTHIDTPKKAQKICLNRETSFSDMDELIVVDVAVADCDGNVCCKDDRRILLDIDGDGEIVAVGNGDPASFEADRILPTEEYREIDEFFVAYDNGFEQRYSIPWETDRAGVETPTWIDSRFQSVHLEEKQSHYEDYHRLVWQKSSTAEYQKTAVFKTTFDARDDDQFIQFERLFGEFEVYLNGQLIGEYKSKPRRTTSSPYLAFPYRFYCRFQERDNHLEVRMRGKNTAQLGIYNGVKIGKFVPPVWTRNTFYGKLRVFIRAKGMSRVTLTATSEGLETATLLLNDKKGKGIL